MKTNHFLTDTVVPHPPYGRLLVQSFIDGNFYKVVVTGMDSNGMVVDERSGSVPTENNVANSDQGSSAESVQLLTANLQGDVIQVLENTLNLI